MWRLAEPRLASLLLVLLLLPVARGEAFPGSVRWGYANCSTCHFNVAGGGVLTPYGRQLSRELLSTWGGKKEAEFAYGSLDLPSWLAFGGDLTYVTTAKEEGSAFRLGQADLEAAMAKGRLLAIATLGRQADSSDSTGDGWTSRRHYLQVAFSQLSFRGGRFLPNYDVWNSTAFTQHPLGWERDSYNLEANWISDRWSLAVTGILAGAEGEPDEPGVSTSVGYFFAEKSKVWLSLVSRGRTGQHRRAGSLSGVFGFGKRAFLMIQADLQRRRTDSPAASSTRIDASASFARETVKGLYLFAFDEMTRRDLGSPGVLTHSFGGGLRWFVRPHFEVQVRYRRQDDEAMLPEYLDGVTGFLRFYP